MDSRGKKLSLKKSAFVRLGIITVLAVLIFYVIGLSINNAGMQNMKKDLQEQLEMRTDSVAGQMEQEFTRLNFFMLELMSNKDLLRYTISYSFLADYERLVYIRMLSGQEYMIKRSSEMADSVQIMFPDQMKTIITEQALYEDLDEKVWNELLGRTKKNRVTYTLWEDRLWMLLPRYEGDRPLFLIAISISRDSLNRKLNQLGSGQMDSLMLLTDEGQILTHCGEESLFTATDGNVLSGQWKDSRTFHAQ
ncbi:MAG: cache domain-containing protein, partial [Clostridia bacterium]|nr:cache domain-containing protein [Clostridia bacterium]